MTDHWEGPDLDFQVPRPQAPPDPARRFGIIDYLVNRYRRRLLVARLLSVACAICRAPAGHPCDPYCPLVTEQVQLERTPVVVIHVQRAHDAIASGAVDRWDFLAQFPPGTEPASFRRD